MTQACDLAAGKVPDIVLCPCTDIDEFKAAWAEGRIERNEAVTEKAWAGVCRELRQGRAWHQAILQDCQPAPPNSISMKHQVVDFYRVFSLPAAFLRPWSSSVARNRIRLLPPYREHLSQAFARFFMRVGLPQDIVLPT
jgi:hypothetical protein